MTVDHPLRRALARLCSDATMGRIVDPVLADIAWEQRRSRWLGYLDLVKALAVHITLSAPRVIARVATDDGYAIPRAAAIALAVSVATAILMIGLSHVNLAPRQGSGMAIAELFILPGTVAWTLPAALLIAIPLALKGRQPTARTRRHAIALAIMYVGLTLALVGWVVPEANQVYRVRTSGISNLPRGPNEIPLSALRRGIEMMQASGASAITVRRAQVGYQQRLAMTVTPLPLSIIALAIAWSRAGRRRPLVAGFVAFATYLLMTPPLQQAIYVQMIRLSSWPVMILGWLPQVLLGVVALYCYRIVNATPPNAWTTLPPPGSWNERIS